LIVDPRTSKALGPPVRPMLLALADQVIDETARVYRRNAWDRRASRPKTGSDFKGWEYLDRAPAGTRLRIQ
jgi:hypothetical protein